jgi:hypothetical protein
MAAVVIAGLALTARDAGVATSVIPALVMAAVVVAGFALTARDTGVATSVIPALTMPAMIVSGLTANEAVAATAVVAALTFAASRDRSLIIDVTTARIDRTTRAIHRASGETLAKGPVIHACVAPARWCRSKAALIRRQQLSPLNVQLMVLFSCRQARNGQAPWRTDNGNSVVTFVTRRKAALNSRSITVR